MDLSLDTLKELFFDFNSDSLLNTFFDIKERSEFLGSMINSKSPEFIDIILNNVVFIYDIDNDDNNNSD